MPKYSWDINDILFEEDVRTMFNATSHLREAYYLSTLWLYGARPDEIFKLAQENYFILPEAVRLTISTSKLRKDGKFKIKERILELARPSGLKTNIYLETIIRYISQGTPGIKLLDYSDRWGEKLINRLGEQCLKKKICPYHFRHSFFTWAARNSWTLDQMMYWKGCGLGGIEMYLKARPQLIALENLHREKTRVFLPPPGSSYGNTNNI